MLNPKLQAYFDGDFNPDTKAYGAECCEEERKLEAFLRENCRSAFSSDEAYTAFEDRMFELIGATQVPVEEAAFEKGVECGLYLAEQGISLK